MKSAKRDLAKEITHGLELLLAEALGQIPPLNLKRTVIEINTPSEVSAIRQKLSISRKMFAQLLHVNKRTLKHWEQGRITPNPQAIILIKLINSRPDIIKDLQAIKPLHLRNITRNKPFAQKPRLLLM